MVKYRLIIEYHKKGNNNTQVATLCCCSRMTVWKVVERLNEVKIETEEVLNLSDDEINYILFPKRNRRGEGFLAIDFKWEEFQMCKHKSSLRLCWRRYCKRAAKQGLKAYSWKSYLYFYIDSKKPRADEDDPHDEGRNKLKRYNLLLSYCKPGGASYEKIKQEKEDWLKSLHLEENKILDWM